MLGFTGAGSGMAIGTLAAEFTARAAGQTKWAACGVKSGIKLGISAISYLAARKLDDARYSSSSFFAEMFAYGSIGSIFLDVALALYPGGITGLAEDWAVTARVYAAGGRKVAARLSETERARMPAFPAGVPNGAAKAANVESIF